MLITIIGAGAVSYVLTRLLTRSPRVKRLVCASRNAQRAAEHVDSRHRKITMRTVDAGSVSSVARVARGTDMIVNASLPEFNVNIMQAAMRIRANYLDLASELTDLKEPEQLYLNESFRKRRLIGLINAGISPGLTNLLVAEAADKLDEVHDVRIRLLEDQESDQPILAWSPEGAVDAVTSRPLIRRRGSFALTKALANPETVAFPKPWGRKRVVSIYGDEVATVPRYIPVPNMDYKSGGSDIEGLMHNKHASHGILPTPRELERLRAEGKIGEARLVARVVVSGTRTGKKQTICYTVVPPPMKKICRWFPGATYVSYPTAVCAAAFILLLPSLRRFGVYPPEALQKKERARVLAYVSRRGLSVTKRLG